MSRVVVSVDPGIRGCGLAVFVDDILSKAAFAKNPELRGGKALEAVAMGHAAWEAVRDCVTSLKDTVLVAEWPRVYATRIRRGETREDPNDLLALCGVDAAIGMFFGRAVVSVEPSEWKGQLPKEACHERIRTRLSDEELQVIERAFAGSKAHNVWDAVGLGLHYLGRLTPRRVIGV